MTRPTESANIKFRDAARAANEQAGDLRNLTDPAYTGGRVNNLAYAIAKLAQGMEELSNGLRATYILLEDVQKRLGK